MSRCGEARPMEHDPVSKIHDALSRSELIDAVRSIRRGALERAFGRLRLRVLFPEEIARLEAAGNHCADWSRVRVADGFDCRRVRQCRLLGDVILGRFAGHAALPGGTQVPSGVYSCTIADSAIGNDALLQDVRLLANVVVSEGGVLFDCGRVIWEGETTFGNGFDLPLAIETGGREVPVHAEIGVGQAEMIALRRSDAEFLARYRQAVAEYVDHARCDKTIIDRHAVICHTPVVQNVYVGPHAVIDSAASVVDCTLLT